MTIERKEKKRNFPLNRIGSPFFPPATSMRIALPIIALTAVFCLPSPARAESHAQYLKDLQLAQAKVMREKKAQSTATALSSPIVKAYFGRYYRVGDSWDVAAWEYINPMMRMTSDPAMLKITVGRGGVFHYEVTDVHTGDKPSVVIRVTQLSDLGMTPVDPKVQDLTLTMSDQMVQTQKEYQILGQSKPVKVSPDGIHSRISALELFPLDVPEILDAVRNRPSKLPTLPEKIQKVAQQVGYSPSLTQSYWLDQDDFFGRPVEILWQQGNPWPSYMKTADGVAILLRTKTAQ